jgi:hypothetical protein
MQALAVLRRGEVTKFRVEPVVLTDEQRVVLERRVGAQRSAQRDVRRARVIFLCA